MDLLNFYLFLVTMLPIYLSWNTLVAFDIFPRVTAAESKVLGMIPSQFVRQIMTFISCWETNVDVPIMIEFRFPFSSRVLKILGEVVFEKYSLFECSKISDFFCVCTELPSFFQNLRKLWVVKIIRTLCCQPKKMVTERNMVLLKA